MSLNWQQIEKHLQDHRKEIGWKGGPCVRVSLKSGEKFLVVRVVESSERVFSALTYLAEETVDENPRFLYVAIDPAEIYLIEAFEPEPRRPEQLKRFTFVVSRQTERIDKKERTPS